MGCKKHWRKMEGSKKVPEAPKSTNAKTEMARDQNVDGKGEVTRGGEGERTGKRKHATQPGPYWLGREFFGRSGARREA